ncbi:MAG TPA: DUF4258 domain-containing protein [Bdellovibrionota bacterium]|nr:DUF4258 domain-containing protein [Bdellovibrionota bacterium]
MPSSRIRRKKLIKWVLSPHAATRMMERRITVDEIRGIIETPDYRIPQGPKWIFGKRLKGRRGNDVAAVILERKEQALWVVITVMVRFERT